jgi:hypothetical protein
VRTGFWRRNLRERDHLEYLGVDGRIFKSFKKQDEGVSWIDIHKIGTSGGML